MKNLGKLNINPHKLIKNDELHNLRGQQGLSPCGEGFHEEICSYILYEIPNSGPVCAVNGVTGYDTVKNTYPAATDIHCSDDPQG